MACSRSTPVFALNGKLETKKFLEAPRSEFELVLSHGSRDVDSELNSVAPFEFIESTERFDGLSSHKFG